MRLPPKSQVKYKAFNWNFFEFYLFIFFLTSVLIEEASLIKGQYLWLSFGSYTSYLLKKINDQLAIFNPVFPLNIIQHLNIMSPILKITPRLCIWDHLLVIANLLERTTEYHHSPSLYFLLTPIHLLSLSFHRNIVTKDINGSHTAKPNIHFQLSFYLPPNWSMMAFPSLLKLSFLPYLKLSSDTIFLHLWTLIFVLFIG